MALITKEAFSKAAGTGKIPGLSILLMRVLKINSLNQLVDKAGDCEGTRFAKFLLDDLGVKLTFDPQDLANIPRTGAFIVTANHPYGSIEALALLKIFCGVRPETLFMGNFLLKKIPGLADYIIPVNPFSEIKTVESISGLKTTLNVLKKGVPVCIFPSGEVSAFRSDNGQVTDKPWHPSMGKIIKKANVPVIPVYFKGNNGLLFGLLRWIHPVLQTAKLPSEMFNKSGHTLHVRIGKAVQPEKTAGCKSPEKLINFFRARTYALGAGLENHPRLFDMKNLFHIHKKPKQVIDALPAMLLEQEISQLESCLLCREKKFSVYMTHAPAIPFLLAEIGRLREITFREVGEGTNKSSDLDRFDIHYMHLLLWDHDEKRLAGAYRVGKGDEIFYSLGKKGFYTAALFKMDKTFYPVLRQSLEMGRSWVRKEYQQQALPLFLLWKGLTKYLAANPGYRYLIGLVSISNKYSNISKSLIVEYISSWCFNQELAARVKPRKKFRTDFAKIDKHDLLNEAPSISDLNNLIAELEPDHAKIPVLLRQYLALNAKFIGFNIDPKFSDSLDGFLVLDLNDVPKDKLEKMGR